MLSATDTEALLTSTPIRATQLFWQEEIVTRYNGTTTAPSDALVRADPPAARGSRDRHVHLWFTAVALVPA